MLILGAFSILHKGYLTIINKYPEASIAILDDDLANELYILETDLRKMPAEQMKLLLATLGRPVSIIGKANVAEVQDADKVVLISDDTIDEFKKRYLAEHKDVISETGFFYHETKNVFSADDAQVEATKVYTEEDMQFMKMASAETAHSGCFWRQVGSVLVKDGKVAFSSCNQMLPNKDECYRIGCIRDQLKPGEKPEICSAIHSEAYVIAQAARDGVGLAGTSIYVTVFPCPPCAKLIAASGIKKCFYSGGWSNFDGERVMKSQGVELIKVPL
ncbi:MAG: hypothetical protein HY817_03460 [Candidatus Abawacabacteria bacterium]|nr:hypothetical protein [Candidatus Abawacabacteria bacterium]